METTFKIIENGIVATFGDNTERFFSSVKELLTHLSEDAINETDKLIKEHNLEGEYYSITFQLLEKPLKTPQR